MARNGIGALILLVLAGLLVVENPVPVALVVLGTPAPALPLGLWLVGALAVGGGLGAIARWVWPPHTVIRTAPESAQPRAASPPQPPKEEDWLEEEPRDRPRSASPPEPEDLEEDEDEDDEDTYLIARYIRR